MRKCNKITKTITGGKRTGLCARTLGHKGRCANNFCSVCGVLPKITSGRCRSCDLKYQRDRRRATGCLPMNVQNSGELHTFPCGCTGVLPQKGAPPNKFAGSRGNGRSFLCRISQIITTSETHARIGGYKPIHRGIPHAAIRLLMEETDCERCGEPLVWEFGRGKTPNLHHDHDTGKLFGFTHHHCNPRALEDQIERQRAEIERLKIKLDKNQK